MIKNKVLKKGSLTAASLAIGCQLLIASSPVTMAPVFGQQPPVRRPLKRLRQQMRNAQQNQQQNYQQQVAPPSVPPFGTVAQPNQPGGLDPASPSAIPSSSTRTTDESQEKKIDKEKKEEKKLKKGDVRGDAPCLCWQTAGVPERAVVVAVHGLGLNSSSFEQFGKRLAPRGVIVYAIDVRGFGSWMQAQGHQDVDFKGCMSDLKSTLEWVRRANPGLPVFLLGESMGGAIALQATAQYPELVDGLISACASGDRFQQKKTDLKVALHLLTPRKDFDIGTQIIDQATDKDSLRTEWSEDPLNRMKLSAVELLQFQKFMNDNHDAAKQIKKTPVLMVQGSKDGLVKPEGTKELFDELATTDKQWLLVPNGEHLIFEEGQFTDSVLSSLAQWMITHAPSVIANRPPNVQAAIDQAKAAIAQNQIPVAINALESAKNISPSDPEIFFLIGSVQMKLNHPLRAKQAFTKAMRLGTGTDFARDANRMLMQLPRDIVAPQMQGAIPPKLAKRLQLLQGSLPPNQLQGFPGPPASGFAGPSPGSFPGEFTVSGPVASQDQQPTQLPPGTMQLNRPGNIALAGGRPQMAALGRGSFAGSGSPATVLVFNAKWCEPCKDMSSIIEQAKQRVGPGVQFVQIDVDDPANLELVDKYDIGPIPTTVFLNSDGSVADFEIGFSGVDGMIKGMSKIRR